MNRPNLIPYSSILKKRLCAPLLLAAAAFLAYGNALHNPFLMDDHAFFSDTKTFNLKFFFWNFIPDEMKHLQIDNAFLGSTYYRPLAHAVPMLEWHAFHYNAFPYHVLNLLLLIALCWMVCRFAYFVTGDERAGLLAALLFCVHPINGLMVDYITAVVFPIQLMLMLGALRRVWITGCLFFILALMCHETAMMLPVYATILHFWRNPQTPRESVGKLAPLWIAAGVYFLWRLSYASLKVSILDQYPAFAVNPFEYSASLAKLFGWYISKLLVPYGIVMIYAAPPVRGPEVWASLGLLAAALGGTCFALAHYYRKDRTSFFALLWFLAGFLPSAFACLFKPKQGFMIEPHWMFFSSIGFFIWLSRLLLKAGKYAPAAAMTLLILLSACSRMGNRLWSSEITYCHYWLEQSPGFKAVMFYLAGAYQSAHHLQKARYYFEQSGNDYGVLNNLGLIDMDLGRYKQAEAEFLASLKEEPRFSAAWSNLGTLEERKGNVRAAENNYLKALQYNRFLPQPRYSLFRVYVFQKRYAEAAQLCLDNLQILPYDNRSLYYLFLAHLAMNDRFSAQQDAAELIGHTRDTGLLLRIARLGGTFGLRPTVEQAGAKVSELKPGFRLIIQ